MHCILKVLIGLFKSTLLEPKLRFYCGLKFQSDLLESEHSEQQQQQENYILRNLIWHVM